MNKAEVVQKISALSNVDPATCEVVLKALQKVLQDELGSSGKMGAISKIMDFIQVLRKDS